MSRVNYQPTGTSAAVLAASLVPLATSTTSTTSFDNDQPSQQSSVVPRLPSSSLPLVGSALLSLIGGADAAPLDQTFSSLGFSIEDVEAEIATLKVLGCALFVTGGLLFFAWRTSRSNDDHEN